MNTASNSERTLQQFKDAVSRTLEQEFSLVSLHSVNEATRRQIHGTVIYRYKGIGQPNADVPWADALLWKTADDIAMSLYEAQKSLSKKGVSSVP